MTSEIITERLQAKLDVLRAADSVWQRLQGRQLSDNEAQRAYEAWTGAAKALYLEISDVVKTGYTVIFVSSRFSDGRPHVVGTLGWLYNGDWIRHATKRNTTWCPEGFRLSVAETVEAETVEAEL